MEPKVCQFVNFISMAIHIFDVKALWHFHCLLKHSTFLHKSTQPQEMWFRHVNVDSLLVLPDIVNIEHVVLFFISHQFGSNAPWFLSRLNQIGRNNWQEFFNHFWLDNSFENKMTEVTLGWCVHSFYLCIFIF